MQMLIGHGQVPTIMPEASKIPEVFTITKEYGYKSYVFVDKLV